MTKNKGITFIISDLGSGGSQKVLVSLLEHFSKNNHISLITFSNTETDFYEIPSNVKRIELNATGESANAFIGICANLKRVLCLRRAIKNTKNTYIVSFIGPTNCLTVLACFGLGIRVVISERNDPARQSYGWFWDLARKKLYRFASVITANSKAAIKTLSYYVPNHKLDFIPNGLAFPSENIFSSAASPNKSILCVARFHDQKAHDILIKAFAQIHNDNSDWHLTLIGEGSLESELKSLVQRLDIVDYVDFKGTLHTLENEYKNHPIFVLPSRYEGTPNALLESMSYGCAPIISSTCEGGLEFVSDGQSGLVFEVDNIDELALKIKSLIKNTELRQELGETAKKSVSKINSDHIFSKWENTIFGELA